MERENLCICPFDLLFVFVPKRLQKHGLLLSIPLDRLHKQAFECPMYNYMYAVLHNYMYAVLQICTARRVDVTSSCKANAGLGTCRHPARQTLAGAALSSKWNSIAWRPSLLGTPRFDV